MSPRRYPPGNVWLTPRQLEVVLAAVSAALLDLDNQEAAGNVFVNQQRRLLGDAREKLLLAGRP